MKLSGGENPERSYAQSLAICVKTLCAVLVLLLSLSLTATAKGQQSTLDSLATHELTYADQVLAERAVYLCVCASNTYKKTKRSIKNAERLLRVERKMNVPDFMFGMTLSAACSESCYDERAKGDYKFNPK